MAKKEIEEIVLKVTTDTKDLDKLNSRMTNTSKSVDNTSKSLLKFTGIIASAFAALRSAMASSDLAKRFEDIDKSLITLFGSAKAASQEFSFLEGVSDRLGLVTLDIANGYSKLVASMDGANISASDQRLIFEAVATAGSALGKSGEEINGVLTAFGQIASKGKVQSEELLQIAERNIPVNALLAKALGVTTAEMKDMVATGNVLASDILPKMAHIMKNEYAEGALKGANTDTARFNRLTNELNMSMSKMGSLINAVVLSLGEGALDAAGDAFERLLGVAVDLAQKVLPTILTVGKSVFVGLDTLVTSFAETFIDAISLAGEGWEILFNDITGEKDIFKSITDSIAIGARSWPQLIVQPFLMAFRAITIGLVKLEEFFYKMTDNLEESILGLQIMWAETFGSSEDVSIAEDAAADFKPRSGVDGDSFLRELDSAVLSLLKENEDTIQTIADNVVSDRESNDKKIDDQFSLLRQRLFGLMDFPDIPSADGGFQPQAPNQGAVSRGLSEGLDIGTVEAAKFLARPIKEQEDIAKKQLGVSDKIEKNTAKIANQTPVLLKGMSL